MYRKFNQWYKIRESFASTFKPKKNHWVSVDLESLKKDPEIAEELFKLIDQAYKNIGGHVDFRSPQNIIDAFEKGEINLIKAVDVDSEPDPDALTIYKHRSGGMKAVASAAKTTSPESKKELVNYKTKAFHTPQYYSEVSDAMAKVLLEAGVPVVEDEETVREVLGKPIQWYGEHPDLNSLKDSVKKVFGKYNGWYGRMLGDGQVHAKIMVGIPLRKAKEIAKNNLD